MPVAPEKYHCLGLWIDLLDTKGRLAQTDFETVSCELTDFYNLCQTHLASFIPLAAPGGRRRIDFGDTVYLELATTGSQFMGLLPKIREIIRSAVRNVQVLVTEGYVFRPAQTETYLMRRGRENHRYQAMVDAQRREEREHLFWGYSEPLKVAWRAEATVKDPDKRRSSIGIQSTALPYLQEEFTGEEVTISDKIFGDITFLRELIPR